MRLYPTRRAIALMAAGAPVGLIVAVAEPSLWAAAGAWVLMTLGLMLADLLLAAPPGDLALDAQAPRTVGLGRRAPVRLEARFDGAAPRELELALDGDARLAPTPVRQRARLQGGRAEARAELAPVRRGEGRLSRLSARWRGPLGLVWRQRDQPLDQAVAVTPDVQGVKDEAVRLFTRDAPFGLKAQIELGEGADFHALKDFQTGMDLRAIDWKQSARHGKLVGREFRTERNHQVILALDCGRLMSAPAAGLPRIDHGINAALLMAFVGLKLGDRIGLFAFDSRPRIASGAASGARAFPLLQQLAARIDYSTEETNFTLGLTTLAGRLERRALIVLFTDFADPTSAELMVENVGRLMRTHLVLFVVFRDEELEGLRAAEPAEPDDIARAVVADALLRQREAVTTRLTRLGVQIVEASAERLGPALVNSYLDILRRELV